MFTLQFLAGDLFFLDFASILREKRTDQRQNKQYQSEDCFHLIDHSSEVLLGVSAFSASSSKLPAFPLRLLDLRRAFHDVSWIVVLQLE